ILHLLLLYSRSGPHPTLHSFPTRRSSDLFGLDQGRAGLEPVRASLHRLGGGEEGPLEVHVIQGHLEDRLHGPRLPRALDKYVTRSEEHTSELQSRFDLVCRLLLEKKKKNK